MTTTPLTVLDLVPISTGSDAAQALRLADDRDDVEVLEDAPLYFKLITYGSITTWFLFITFYVKPRMFKNEEEKLNLMIDRLIRLQEQFD